MANEIKLKSCPFCGREPITSSEGHYVACSSCFNDHFWLTTDIWNTRDNKATYAEAIEVAKEIKQGISNQNGMMAYGVGKAIKALRAKGGLE